MTTRTVGGAASASFKYDDDGRLSYLFTDHPSQSLRASLGSTTMRVDGVSGIKLTELRDNKPRAI